VNIESPLYATVNILNQNTEDVSIGNARPMNRRIIPPLAETIAIFTLVESVTATLLEEMPGLPHAMLSTTACQM
jgi:hypothetical protein